MDVFKRQQQHGADQDVISAAIQWLKDMGTRSKNTKKKAKFARAAHIIHKLNGRCASALKEMETVQIDLLHHLMTRLYNTGYLAGHHDTVESVYYDIWEIDMDTCHKDVVEEWLQDQV